MTYGDITASQPVTIMEAQWLLVSDSVVVDQFHSYAININGVSGYGLDKVDPSVVEWMTADADVCTVDQSGIVTAVADGKTFVGSTHPLLSDSLLVSVENPKGRVTTIENAPIDPATWDITQSGGKDRIVTALDNGMQIDFTGASSRNPYIKLAKAVQIWGIPDTLRLRLAPGEVQFKTVKILLENAYDERVTVEYPIEGTSDSEVVIDIPVTDIYNATDLGNFPLHLVYYYFTYSAVATGASYSFKIPGMELIYANMPPDEHHALGDVNLDGEVNIADVNTVIDVILTGGTWPTADVNGDGEVNIADINAIIALILS